MKLPLPSVATLFLTAVSGTAQPLSGAPQTSAGKPLFTFRSTLWMNLHHFLYVLGRARNDTRDSQRAAVAHAPENTEGFASLGSKERDAWERAVAWYEKNVSPMDAVFDHDLVEMTNALAAAAPVDSKVWWERHSRSNRARIEELQALLERYGQPISDTITKAYLQSTAILAARRADRGDVRIRQLGGRGSEGLETIFHEAMHQWDDAMIPRLNEAAARLHASVPRDLFHSLIFYTAGYATARVVPGHHPYAAALDRLAGSFAK